MSTVPATVAPMCTWGPRLGARGWGTRVYGSLIHPIIIPTHKMISDNITILTNDAVSISVEIWGYILFNYFDIIKFV